MENENVSAIDSENIYKNILETIISYPNFPLGFEANNNSIKWNSIDSENSIGLFTENGTTYVRQYVSGNYVAEMNLQIVFRSSPTTNKTSINAQSILQSLASWIEINQFSFDDSNIVLEKVKQTKPVTVVYQDETTTDYGCLINIRYLFIK